MVKRSCWILIYLGLCRHDIAMSPCMWYLPQLALLYLVRDSSPMTAIPRLLHMPLVREGIHLPALLIPFRWYYIDYDLWLRRSITSLGGTSWHHATLSARDIIVLFSNSPSLAYFLISPKGICFSRLSSCATVQWTCTYFNWIVVEVLV